MFSRLWRWIVRYWRAPSPALPISETDLAALRDIVDPPFDWLKTYGPLWTPESTAFWLAPSTPDQLAAWWTKYRPGQLGIKEVETPTYGKIRIEIVNYDDPHRINTLQQYQNALANTILSQSSFSNYHCINKGWI